MTANSRQIECTPTIGTSVSESSISWTKGGSISGNLTDTNATAALGSTLARHNTLRESAPRMEGQAWSSERSRWRVSRGVKLEHSND